MGLFSKVSTMEYDFLSLWEEIKEKYANKNFWLNPENIFLTKTLIEKIFYFYEIIIAYHILDKFPEIIRSSIRKYVFDSFAHLKKLENDRHEYVFYGDSLEQSTKLTFAGLIIFDFLGYVFESYGFRVDTTL